MKYRLFKIDSEGTETDLDICDGAEEVVELMADGESDDYGNPYSFRIVKETE